MPLYKRYAKELNLRARDLMAAPPITISEKSTIEEAAQMMWEKKKVGSLMVTAEDGTLTGVVTERDLIFAIVRSMVGKGLPIRTVVPPEPPLG